MARYSRMEVLAEILRTGLVPLFYHGDLETSRAIIAACAEGGATVVEYLNRGEAALEVFSALSADLARVSEASIILGSGSVVDAETALLSIAAGANFIVGPSFSPEVARVCNRRKVAYLPGCFTAGEIGAAEEAGVEIVKVFFRHAEAGQAFVRSVLETSPQTRIIQTGVDITFESMVGWFDAGACALGTGSRLIRDEWVRQGDWAAITALTAQALRLVQRCRRRSDAC